MPSTSQDVQVRFGQMQPLWENGERVFYRAPRDEPGSDRHTVLVVISTTENPTIISLDRIAHEYVLKDQLDALWAVRPLDLVRERGRTMLVLEDPDVEPLHRLLGSPMEPARFLRFAEALTAALRGLHERGLIHKDISPANVLVNDSTSHVWLTGFGVTSRLPRERQPPSPPEFLATRRRHCAPRGFLPDHRTALIREAAFSSSKEPPQPVRAPVDPTGANEAREASGRRRILRYDNRKTNARPARSS